MNVIGVIAEFNPFHSGHARLLSYARDELSADYVLAVMSGNFVQRGGPACQSRHVRSHEALAAGFDAVLSLPVGISTSSAEGFAEGGVRALTSLGIVNTLLFGSESGDLARLKSCADMLLTEEPSRSERMKAFLKQGHSYPKARALAFPESADVLSGSNNILALEYLKALKRLGSPLCPRTLARNGGYYGSLSAFSIRADAELLPEANAPRGPEASSSGSPALENDLRRRMPPAAADIFMSDILENGLVTEDDFSLLLSARLYKALSFEEYLPFAGVTENLARRIFENRAHLTKYRTFAADIATRTTTNAAVRRALLSILLEIPKGAERSLPYLRVLGCRKEAQSLHREIAGNSTIPVFYRIAETEALSSEEELSHLRREIFSQSLYEVVRARKAGRPPETDLTRPLLRV